MNAERELGRRGVAAARRRLEVEIERTGAIYKPTCCGRPFASWDLAGQHVIDDECAAAVALPEETPQ